MALVVDNNRTRSRVKLGQFLICLGVFIFFTFTAKNFTNVGWWLWIGIPAFGTLIILEPKYTVPASSFLLSLAAIGIYFTASRNSVEILWRMYLTMILVLLIVSVLTLFLAEGRPQELAKYITTRLGRPQYFGYGALLIESFRISSTTGLPTGIHLLIGVIVIWVLSGSDWIRIISYFSPSSAQLSVIESAIEPNILLISVIDRLDIGDRVKVTADGVSNGTVAAMMAHKEGLRAQIVLDGPWTSVTSVFGRDCTVEHVEDEQKEAVGFAVEGSTERTLCFYPLTKIDYGDSLYWENGGESFLYQVSSLSLSQEHWDQSKAINVRAGAVLLGSVTDDSVFELSPKLPEPFQLLRTAKDFTRKFNHEEYVRIGVVSGTKIPFGLKLVSLQNHHMAILGMTGMGKTSITRKIIDLLAQSATVVAVDGTGEYAVNFKYTRFSDNSDLHKTGVTVFEPKVIPTKTAADFIKSVMLEANEEYKLGSPNRRTMVFEEAHTLLPEFGFYSDRDDSQYVAQSCRYILQARKFGINFIFISQRTAVISKSALSQCESYVIFRTLDDTSLNYIESVVGHDLRRAVPSLKRYQAICIGPAFNAPQGVIVDLDPPTCDDSSQTVDDAGAVA